MPKEETFPIPLTYTDVTGSSHTDLDALQEKRIDHWWNVVSSRHLSNEAVWREQQKAQKQDRFFRGRQIGYLMARGMGSPRQVRNRRRTGEGPEPARVQTPVRSGVAHAWTEG